VHIYFKTLVLLGSLFSYSSWATTPQLPKGNAAWVYDVNYGASYQGAPAMWADWINQYNSATDDAHLLSTIYTYGGDLEYYPGTTQPYLTSFPAKNQLAAKTYKSVVGVRNVVAVVDGQMNGGQTYSPDLSKLTTAQVQAWADATAALFCTYDFIDGLQIDLEPARAPYIANLMIYLARLSADLMLSTNNCASPNHLNGRSLGAFMSASSATSAVFKALGTNGYVIMSGYDLSDAPAGVPTLPSDYYTQITNQINTLITNAAPSNGSYIIGVPAAASAHEFTQYITAAGAVTFGYPMYSRTQANYVTEAVQACHSLLAGRTNWLGTALWGFSLEMANPPRSRNLFYPATPFEQSGEMNYLRRNL
jgi:hypothetical protein